MDYRGRERLVLASGLVAACAVTALLVAAIAGASPGRSAGRLVFSLVLLYLCARMWGHGATLEERGTRAALGRAARLASPVVLVLLVVQTWATSTAVHITFGLDVSPHVDTSVFTRLEWTADVAVFALFLLTATSVWIEGSTGVSAVCSRIAGVFVVFVSLDLFAGAWGVWSLLPQWRLVTALVVLSLAGTIAVATLRRIERLDELTTES
jgi:hypothetical protein